MKKEFDVVLRWLQPGRGPELFFTMAGFLPILCLSMALIGIFPLHILAPGVLPLTILAALVIGCIYPDAGKKAFHGLLAGIVAVLAYDTFRLSFVALGFWSDFIPIIGKLALNDSHAHWAWGYAWRILFNGGAMGIAFGVLPFRGVKHGMTFGVFICICLFGTLAISAQAQKLMFPLSWVSCTLAMTGHLIYGGILGTILEKIAPNEGVIRKTHRTSENKPAGKNFFQDAWLLVQRKFNIIC